MNNESVSNTKIIVNSLPVGATPIRKEGLDYKEKRNEKRKKTKLETMKKRGLLQE